MRKLCLFTFVILIVASVWAADWPMPGGNPQRNGWAASERQINKANVSGLKLLYKYQSDNRSDGLNSLTAPIINGNLITYRGFKEMLIFAGSADKVFSVDADLSKLIWETQLPYNASTPQRRTSTPACPAGLTAPVVMAGSSSAFFDFAARARQRPAATGVRRRHPSPYLPPLAQSVYPLLPTTLTQLDAVYAVGSDGYLHVLNSSTGQDLIPSVRFVPPNAKVTSLNLRNNVVYATTSDNCDGYQDALFALDLLSPVKTVTSFLAPGGFSGAAGTTIGSDGTLYVQIAYGPDKRGRYYDTVVALTPTELKPKTYFRLGDKPVDRATPGISPVVFSFQGRDVVLAGGRNGRLYLLDSKSLAAPDHPAPLCMSDPLIRTGKKYKDAGFRGAFSTWSDVDTGTRWFYAPVFGSLRLSGGSNAVRSVRGDGSILALKLGGTPEQPMLQPAWISSPVISPAPAVIANGMIFVLSKGQPDATPAALRVFDALTGKELYSSGKMISGAASGAALALANGRVYFTTQENAVYCFGIPSQHTQLSSR
jgi:outer membrane protein assembly factor BamB